MTGYESKRAAAQDKLAQPALEPNWICNECGAQEFTAALSEADLDYLACSNCGGDEFHKEALAQPVQDMEFARIRIQVGNKFVEGLLTHAQLLRADNPWALIEHKVAICVATLKEIYEQKT